MNEWGTVRPPGAGVGDSVQEMEKDTAFRWGVIVTIMVGSAIISVVQLAKKKRKR